MEKSELMEKWCHGLFLLLIIGVFLTTPITFAHPGGLADDGCHYCRTNCDYFGEAWNQRHCHEGFSYSPSSYSAVRKDPTCPSNSYYNGTSGKCSCNTGYTPSLSNSSCVKIPLNAHAVNSPTDAWLCDWGYEEVGKSCDFIEIPKCPIDATYDDYREKCSCDSGYAPSLDGKRCVEIPEHAYAVNSPTEIWLCDSGYEEVENSCVATEDSDNMEEDFDFSQSMASAQNAFQSTKEDGTSRNYGLEAIIGLGAIIISYFLGTKRRS